jgi:Raf kinase inhibitor-like YbhB/YbcL family protein
MFTLRSTAFAHGAEIPSLYTCEGRDIAPPLEWADPPAGTRSFALIVDDPDAPDPAAPKRVYVHWVLYNIPVEARQLPEGASSGSLPPGTLVGRNDDGETGYNGPCPPIGRHRYFHKLYALDAVLPALGAVTKSELEVTIRPHVLAQTELIGTYAAAHPKRR